MNIVEKKNIVEKTHIVKKIYRDSGKIQRWWKNNSVKKKKDYDEKHRFRKKKWKKIWIVGKKIAK